MRAIIQKKSKGILVCGGNRGQDQERAKSQHNSGNQRRDAMMTYPRCAAGQQASRPQGQKKKASLKRLIQLFATSFVRDGSMQGGAMESADAAGDEGQFEYKRVALDTHGV